MNLREGVAKEEVKKRLNTYIHKGYHQSNNFCVKYQCTRKVFPSGNNHTWHTLRTSKAPEELSYWSTRK